MASFPRASRCHVLSPRACESSRANAISFTARKSDQKHVREFREKPRRDSSREEYELAPNVLFFSPPLSFDRRHCDTTRSTHFRGQTIIQPSTCQRLQVSNCAKPTVMLFFFSPPTRETLFFFLSATAHHDDDEDSHDRNDRNDGNDGNDGSGLGALSALNASTFRDVNKRRCAQATAPPPSHHRRCMCTWRRLPEGVLGRAGGVRRFAFLSFSLHSSFFSSFLRRGRPPRVS